MSTLSFDTSDAAGADSHLLQCHGDGLEAVFQAARRLLHGCFVVAGPSQSRGDGASVQQLPELFRIAAATHELANQLEAVGVAAESRAAALTLVPAVRRASLASTD